MFALLREIFALLREVFALLREKIFIFMSSIGFRTNPMSETCKIRIGQVKFLDRKPELTCKTLESKQKK